MADPRFDANADLKAVPDQPGWFKFEHISRIIGQGSGTRYVSGKNGDALFEQYARFLGTGYHKGILVDVELGTDTPSTHTGNTYVSAGKFVVEIQGSITSGGGAYGLEVECTQGVSGVFNGQMSAISSYLQVDAATRVLTRTYQAIELGSYIGAGNTMPALACSFIRCTDAGSVPLNQFLDISGMSVSGALEVDSGAVGTIYGYLKVRTPAGQGYLVLYSSHS